MRRGTNSRSMISSSFTLPVELKKKYRKYLNYSSGGHSSLGALGKHPHGALCSGYDNHFFRRKKEKKNIHQIVLYWSTFRCSQYQ